MTKRDITMDEIVEGVFFSAIGVTPVGDGDGNTYVVQPISRVGARRALSHLLTTANITEAQLIALARGEAVVVGSGAITEAVREERKACQNLCLQLSDEHSHPNKMDFVRADAFLTAASRIQDRAMLAALKARP